MRKLCSHSIADMSVLVGSVRGDPITFGMSSHKTMASLSGKGCQVPPLVVLVQLDVLPSLVVDHPDEATVRL